MFYYKLFNLSSLKISFKVSLICRYYMKGEPTPLCGLLRLVYDTFPVSGFVENYQNRNFKLYVRIINTLWKNYFPKINNVRRPICINNLLHIMTITRPIITGSKRI